MSLWSLVPTVVHELMTILDHLDSIVVRYHTEREGSLVVSLHYFACSTMQQLAVHEEVGTLNRYAGALVCHVAREAFTVDDCEFMYGHIIDLVIKCY